MAIAKRRIPLKATLDAQGIRYVKDNLGPPKPYHPCEVEYAKKILKDCVPMVNNEYMISSWKLCRDLSYLLGVQISNGAVIAAAIELGLCVKSTLPKLTPEAFIGITVKSAKQLAERARPFYGYQPNRIRAGA